MQQFCITTQPYYYRYVIRLVKNTLSTHFYHKTSQMLCAAKGLERRRYSEKTISSKYRFHKILIYGDSDATESLCQICPATPPARRKTTNSDTIQWASDFKFQAAYNFSSSTRVIVHTAAFTLHHWLFVCAYFALSNNITQSKHCAQLMSKTPVSLGCELCGLAGWPRCWFPGLCALKSETKLIQYLCNELKNYKTTKRAQFSSEVTVVSVVSVVTAITAWSHAS